MKADDHQTINAQSLVKAGAALLIPEKDLTADRLATELRNLEGNRELLQKMSRASGNLGHPEAAREIADVCVQLCSGRLVREGRNLPPAKGKSS
jgi:UDP-N-acetylglucosamine--N-acetylmuramyl-(pentapeptide) pyrophosphoryl-undecaprenol N-acetylglucosamine transferase